ncbi:hypothetical protein C0V72_05715 [Porphyrobacter sp. TH134]|uniref:ATP-binding protein n=1 Tax=Porphyrobacter sp. TH134 TaxID=2067450 RepID=UPI000C7974FF|nr:ATP-binding protein [Porphyrobacter sp. TH134]PLK24572.1 hypothetical protein C0V72_05715 [Porphyrobacter sp. TH134]
MTTIGTNWTQMPAYARSPERAEWYYLLVITILLVVLVPFEPYDWVQRAVTAVFEPKDYRGDAVIIAIDEETERGLPTRTWSEADLSGLLTTIGAQSPRQIIINRQYFKFSSPAAATQLREALADLPKPAVWVIELSPRDAAMQTLTAGGTGAFAQRSTQIPAALTGLVVPAAMIFKPFAFGAPIYALTSVKTDEGVFPTVAAILAAPAAKPRDAIIDIDVSYNPSTIPAYSAGDVLSGKVNPAVFKDRQVVISFTRVVGRDTAVTPNNSYTPTAALAIMAAETVRNGPGLFLGWVPAFALAMAASILWLVLRRPYGRLIAAATFLAILLSPLALEPLLVFQQTSQGLGLLLLLGANKLFQRGRSLVQEYRTASETKSRFLAQASHDLRQPIHAIGLLTDRLKDTDLSSEQAQIVAKISWSVDNASRMFRALLDIAAIESGALKAEIAPVRISDLFAELDSQNALAAEQQNVDLRLVPSTVVVETDRALLATMLQNLVANAIRYSPGKRVLVGCRRRGTAVTVLVIDNGRGISPSDLEHVRKEFFRSSRRSDLRSDNKGLGLAIVSRLASMLGLQFALQSEQSRGTVASIGNLKRLRVSNEAALPLPNLVLPLAGVKVFVIDDHAETLASTQRLLEGWGCVVDGSQLPPEILPDCDMLLSDFDFGNGENLAANSSLLRQINASKTHLVVISGHHADQIEASLTDTPAIVLSKPLRAAELRSALMAIRSA